MVSDTVKNKMIDDNKKRTVPQWLDISFDFVVICFIVFNGYIVTGIFYMIHTVIMQNGWDEIEEKIAAKTA